jgi:hypothetical protein
MPSGQAPDMTKSKSGKASLAGLQVVDVHHV